MATKLRINKLTYVVGILSLCALLLLWWTGGWDKVMAADSSGKAKAQSLVAAYAKHAGVHGAVHQTLDDNNDRSFGDFGFHYFPQRDMLQARAFIVESDEKDRPETANDEKKVDVALNDPKIGGLYDRGGGHFFLDEEKQITFLVKDYRVSTTTPSYFVMDVDNLNSLAGVWVMSWFGHLARQTFGHEPLPTHFVTRENDPYKR